MVAASSGAQQAGVVIRTMFRFQTTPHSTLPAQLLRKQTLRFAQQVILPSIQDLIFIWISVETT
jgi:hypothetical protein